jgi:DNA-binding NtrC family response regulator
MQAGADHFLTKPVELPVVGAVVARLVELGRRERLHLAEDASRPAAVVDPFKGSGAEMKKLAAQARRVAESGSTVLIQGETGVGKGVLARWIHAHGPRRGEPFVDLNCSALARELVESELFGHRKGAFTGAVADKTGLLEIATRGTVFLDEIGDLDPQVQPKLLKALEEQRIRRVGDVTDREVDVRLVAATHRDLAEAAKQGHFRQDLFYRISTVPLRVPPLRERREDIPELARHILNGVAAELGRLSVSLSEACVDAMCSYDWPGNVRELRNVLERAVLLTDRDTLLPKDLLFEEPRQDDGPVSHPKDLSLGAHERRHIEVVLQLTSGNVTEAARRLRIPRSSLYEKISRHGIDLSEIRT